MDVEIIAGWRNPEQTIGLLHIERSAGKEIISIEYANEWLSQHSGVFLDPDLNPYKGRQYVPANKKIFGFLSDTSPDRWGRKLIQKKFRIEASSQEKSTRTLNESDYLLGVSDVLRYGGIRFRDPETGTCYSSSSDPVPPIAELRALEQAARGYELSSDKDEAKWLRQIFEPGSSLGGARPKANVVDPDGTLWIAKFPSQNDEYDVGAWEKVEHDLAKICGINVPDAKIMKLSSFGTTFLTKRFDRTPTGSRIHMMSAMTALGLTDGHTEGSGYLDIADIGENILHCPDRDLPELWKRMAFGILTSNHDDHLRNHGFMLLSDGWHLSPAFDLNPVPYANSLSLEITNGDAGKDIQNAVSVSEYFRVSKKDAIVIVRQMQAEILANWKLLAKRAGISEKGCIDMNDAFSECRHKLECS